jgi:CubicO group peptidase (beta-lactamase class C family)
MRSWFVYLVIFSLAVGFIVFNPLTSDTSSSVNVIADSNNTIVPSTFNSNSKHPLGYNSYPKGGKSVFSSVSIYSVTPKASVFNTEDIFKIFDKYVTNTFQSSGIPGAAVLVIQNGQVKYLKCLGVKDMKTKAAIRPDTLFQIGSCSKAFTSTLIAQLVDAGVMKWDDKVTKYFPSEKIFKMYDNSLTSQLTIRDLLSHRTGLPSYGSGGDQLWLSFNDNYPDMLYKMRYVKPTAKLRTTYQYNNIMYALAGVCAARAGMNHWEDLIDQNLFQPLKMNTATTNFADFINAPDRTRTYSNFNGVYYEHYSSDLTAVGSAGSLSVSIKEMGNWIKFQLNNGNFQGKQLVSSKSLQETRKPMIKISDDNYYAMGWITGPGGYIAHAGDAVPSKTQVFLNPSQKWGMVVFSNEGNYGLKFNTAITSALGQLYKYGKIKKDTWPQDKKETDEAIEKYLAEKNKKPTPPIIPALNLNTYTGKYSNGFYGQINVANSGTQLKLYLGKNKIPLILKHWNGNIYRINSPLTTSGTFTQVEFKSISKGKAQQVNVNYLTAMRTNGTFKRTK